MTTKSTPSVWKVNTKIGEAGRSVEISAVIEGSHGDISWGWDSNKDKIIVLSVLSLYQPRPVSPAIIEQAQKEAQVICDARNANPEELYKTLDKHLTMITGHSFGPNPELYKAMRTSILENGLEPGSLEGSVFVYFAAIFDGLYSQLEISVKKPIMYSLARVLLNVYNKAVAHPDTHVEDIYKREVFEAIEKGIVDRSLAERHLTTTLGSRTMIGHIKLVLLNLAELP